MRACIIYIVHTYVHALLLVKQLSIWGFIYFVRLISLQGRETWEAGWGVVFKKEKSTHADMECSKESA